MCGGGGGGGGESMTLGRPAEGLLQRLARQLKYATKHGGHYIGVP